MSWVQQIDDMADSELLYRFESGLKPDARNQLAFMKAKNFDEAVMIVSRFEANRKVGREDHTNQLNYTKTHVPRDNTNRYDYNKTEQKERYSKKPYDMKEIKCYKCGKTGHMKKDCRVKIAAIAESIEEETQSKYSSLYMHQTLSAKDGKKLMTLNGSVNGNTVKIISTVDVLRLSWQCTRMRNIRIAFNTGTAKRESKLQKNIKAKSEKKSQTYKSM